MGSKEKMQNLGGQVMDLLPTGTGFVLILYEHGAPQRNNYITNFTDMNEVIQAMQNVVDKLKKERDEH